MSNDPRQLFRADALERMSSPEKIDQLMEVTTLRDWVPLTALAVMLTGLITWSVVGRLPLNVHGRGAFVDAAVAAGAESHIVDVLARGAGHLVRLSIQRGDTVVKGQVLGVIDQADLREDLATEKQKLDNLLRHSRAVSTVSDERTALDRRAIDHQRETIRKALEDARRLAPRMNDANLASLRGQRRTLNERLANARSMVGVLEQGLAQKEALREQGLIPDSVYIAARREALDAHEQLSAVTAQLRELDAREVELQRVHQRSQDEIGRLTGQLRDLDVRARSVDLENVTHDTARSAEIDGVRRQVSLLETLIKDRGEIRAEVSGRVLELTGVLGQMVSPGTRLASIGAEAVGHRQLDGVAYFTIADGKRIDPGMRVQVTPDTVKREEFGGIVGTVTRVSEYPITPEGVINVVNNAALAQDLTAGGRTIEVFIRFEADPATKSGYRWTSSKGPDLTVTDGTTASARVTLQERAPITYVLPFLQSWLGAH